jgi:hypothetical protein
MTHIDLDPDVVSAAGRRTSATSSTWEQWASQSENLLRNAAADAQDAAFTSALEGYLSDLNPAMHGVAKQVDALGTNTVSASNHVANADTMSATLLGQQGQRDDSLGSALRRPINP